MYNKLFTKILDSSIWMTPTTTRIVWITFLAMMDEDGFVALASTANVSHRARVTMEEAELALSALESSEPSTATADDDGKRIERVPGGWMVLNAEKYREMVRRVEMKEANRERVTAFRDRKKMGVTERMAKQGHKCGCCSNAFKEPYNLYVVEDHCHKTGAQRDLLCQSCNKNVGQLENGKTILDDEKRAWAAAYVKRHCNAPVMQSDTDTDTKKRESRLFQAPALALCRDEMVRIGLKAEEGDKFFNHYESTGWMVGKVKMKSWTAAAQNWKTRADEFAARGGYKLSPARPIERNIGWRPQPLVTETPAPEALGKEIASQLAQFRKREL